MPPQIFLKIIYFSFKTRKKENKIFCHSLSLLKYVDLGTPGKNFAQNGKINVIIYTHIFRKIQQFDWSVEIM